MPRRHSRLPNEVRGRGHGRLRDGHVRPRRGKCHGRRRRVHYYAHPHSGSRRLVLQAPNRQRSGMPDSHRTSYGLQDGRSHPEGLPRRRRRRRLGQGRLRRPPHAQAQPHQRRRPGQRRRVPQERGLRRGPRRAALQPRGHQGRELGPDPGQRRQGHHQRQTSRALRRQVKTPTHDTPTGEKKYDVRPPRPLLLSSRNDNDYYYP
mmetsp:Transcript_3544/g.11638  ORF Transcript_3544/g.11638 Transcript_3544/m.11638 type:complete len:205 (+) Transcript_3544:304-918(+)